jgi:RNA polymerase sigma factor (sigma-70 family)
VKPVLDYSHEVAPVHADLSEYLESERDRLVGLAYLLLGNSHDAQDAVQAASVRLTASDLSHVKDLPSYARRAVVNECASWKRSLIRRERAEQQLSQPEEADDLIDALDLAQSLQRLSAKHRAVVALRFYLDLDDQAASEILGCAPATVRSRLSRALRKLRADLGEGDK